MPSPSPLVTKPLLTCATNVPKEPHGQVSQHAPASTAAQSTEWTNVSSFSTVLLAVHLALVGRERGTADCPPLTLFNLCCVISTIARLRFLRLSFPFPTVALQRDLDAARQATAAARAAEADAQQRAREAADTAARLRADLATARDELAQATQREQEVRLTAIRIPCVPFASPAFSSPELFALAPAECGCDLEAPLLYTPLCGFAP